MNKKIKKDELLTSEIIGELQAIYHKNNYQISGDIEDPIYTETLEVFVKLLMTSPYKAQMNLHIDILDYFQNNGIDFYKELPEKIADNIYPSEYDNMVRFYMYALKVKNIPLEKENAFKIVDSRLLSVNNRYKVSSTIDTSFSLLEILKPDQKVISKIINILELATVDKQNLKIELQKKIKEYTANLDSLWNHQKKRFEIFYQDTQYDNYMETASVYASEIKINIYNFAYKISRDERDAKSILMGTFNRIMDKLQEKEYLNNFFGEKSIDYHIRNHCYEPMHDNVKYFNAYITSDNNEACNNALKVFGKVLMMIENTLSQNGSLEYPEMIESALSAIHLEKELPQQSGLQRQRKI